AMFDTRPACRQRHKNTATTLRRPRNNAETPLWPHECGALSPAPYQRSRGTSVARHSASQTSLGSAPDAKASFALTCSNSASTRSRDNATPSPSPNSSTTALRNSLTLTKGASEPSDRRRSPQQTPREPCQESQ